MISRHRWRYDFSTAHRVRLLGLLLVAIVVQTFLAGEARCEPALAKVPSLYDDAKRFLEAIARADQAKSQTRPLTGLTVPHHLLVADLIAKGFSLVDPEQIDKVVILSPDHFKRTRLPFATTRRDFQTIFGTVAASRPEIDKLLKVTDLIGESSLFVKEHGIHAVLPFIKHYLPRAQIIPIAVAIRSRRPQWDRLVEHLAPLVDKSTLIVQSTDFSHYLSAKDAAEHDQRVLNILAAGDLDQAALFNQPKDIDSVGSQYIQLKLQRKLFGALPVVLYNSNSQDFSDVTESRTTSYLVQVYEPQVRSRVGTDLEGSTIYCFGGDVFLGRSVAKALSSAQAIQRAQRNLRSALNGCRLLFNLEGVIVDTVPANLGATQLAMPSRLAQSWLSGLNIAAVSVANNHASDLGADAFNEMLEMLHRTGVSILRPGVPIDVGSIRIIAMTDLDNHSGARSSLISDQAILNMAPLTATRLSVAFMHWGEEFIPKAGTRQEHLSKLLADAGFSLVIGAHPHVASRGLTLLKNGFSIEAYSLGNLLFDQTARYASGALLELRVFEQGTFFARLVPIPNYFDLLRRSENGR